MTSGEWGCHSIKIPKCRSYKVKENRRFGGDHQEPHLPSDHPGGGTHTWYFEEFLLRENGLELNPKPPKAGAAK